MSDTTDQAPHPIQLEQLRAALTALGIDTDLLALRTVVIEPGRVTVTRWPATAATSETTIHRVEEQA